MNRTFSKGKLRQVCTYQKTQKKKPKSREISSVTKSTIWLKNKKMIVITEDENKILIGLPEKYERKRQEQAILTKYFKIENPQNIKVNRARIIDWFLDVCRCFQLRWESYWCAIEIMDYLINIINCISITNIHIMGVTSLFMASKIHENSPPSIYSLVQKAVYKAFTVQQVLQTQAKILMYCANNKTKPMYMSTIYNCLFQSFPNLQFESRIQIIRKLILFWMDPVMALKYQNINCSNKEKETLFISYQDIINLIVSDMVETEPKQTKLHLQQVRIYYAFKYDCQNLDPRWHGLKRLRL